jgi:hypothetical protein
MEDSSSSGGRKRNQAGELDDESRHRKVAATLSGAAYATLLQAGTPGDLQHLAMPGQYASVEDTLYSVMLQQQQQQQRQTGNFRSKFGRNCASLDPSKSPDVTKS